MLRNGLIYAGEKGKALTWMNAYVDGKPVTPRTGCAVEVNVLWYNAVMFSLNLADKAKDQEFIRKWHTLPDRIKSSFIEVFWDEGNRYLADFVDGDYKDMEYSGDNFFSTHSYRNNK